MLLYFKPCENLLLLPPPKFFTTTNTNSKPHLFLHHHHHHHHVKLLHCSPLKAHFKSTLSSSSPLSSPAPPPPSEEEEEEEDSLPPAAGSSSSSLTTSTTADFLMDSGGLSYVEALQVIREKPPTLLQDGGRKPRSVIAYFESIGFSKTHISKAISKYPELLVSDVEKTLKPKIQLFLDYGFSESDIADLISVQPSILHTSLETRIKPALDLIKSLVETDEDLIKSIKRNGPFLLRPSHRKWIEPNMDVLRQHGVPDWVILHLVLSSLRALMSTPKVFKRIVERIVSLGFEPETRKFSIAVAAMSAMNSSTWDSKIELLKGLGWSDEQILDAFRRCPKFITLSRENLKESIEFFKESLNWDASVLLSQRPVVLNFSLKRRVIPRYAVLKCLMSKGGIIKEDKIFVHMLTLSETLFLSKYVFNYQDQLPYLYEVYEKECMMGCEEEEEDNGEITNQQHYCRLPVRVSLTWQLLVKRLKALYVVHEFVAKDMKDPPLIRGKLQTGES